MSSLSDIARSIEASLTSRPPYCSGTLPVPPEQLILFYDIGGKLDLSDSAPEELDKLSDACQPATFGVNKEDVYDESYRKARKLDIRNFATLFNIDNIGLVDVIRNALLEGEDENRRIKVEMYKLNVYDSFFKPHKDTPRSASMFGSLVVVFPTPHEGGEFVLKQDGHEWEVDFARMISDTVQQPCIGYVSFFADVEHEVRIVTAGHRITLTYNLYFIPETQTVPAIFSSTPYEQRLAALLYTLLNNPSLLPEGGYLGFGLRHQYPVETGMEVEELQDCLKGNDAALARALSALGVTWQVRVFYRDFGASNYRYNYLHKRIVDLSGSEVEDDYNYGWYMGEGAEEVAYASLDGQVITQGCYDYDPPENGRKLARVTKMASMTSSQSPYVTYGNEPTLEHLYGDVCIVADLPASEHRTIKEVA
ncbi:hypothetical protein M404DRAFT_157967 [Pisolithus tinctorius Marx 270]|uniref:Fe2OG dioxygenase domain-containing protein n=1 Tax=Pisolithus tinctorius Marx 270 TaxID=870435 RepID=A0A0C3IMX2_PISTI|nr:hypothetical protein M404DRAFT_157967 [Pisolithus tinctorius Marx 270]